MRNIAALAAFALAATQTGVSAQTMNVQSLMGRRVHGCRRHPAAGRRGGRIPAERQRACLLFCR